MTLTIYILTKPLIPNMNDTIELTDWILNKNRVRGSVTGDGGFWVCGANNEGDMIKYEPEKEKPISFNPTTRVITIANGQRFIVAKATACKAVGLNKESERILNSIS